MMSLQEEITQFQMGLIKWPQLTEQAREYMKREYLVERCGFEPTMLIRCSGVTSNGRQSVLAKAKKLLGIKAYIPIRITREENKHDLFAIAVHLPTIRDMFGDYHAYEHAGYIPRGRCNKCGITITGPRLQANHDCSNCGNQLSGKDINGNLFFTDETIKFNEYICRLMDEDKVEFGLDTILSDPAKPDLEIGLSIAIRIKNE